MGFDILLGFVIGYIIGTVILRVLCLMKSKDD